MKIKRENEESFKEMEKGRGGEKNNVRIGQKEIIEDEMRGNGGVFGKGGGYKSKGMKKEMVRKMKGKVEDVDEKI